MCSFVERNRHSEEKKCQPGQKHSVYTWQIYQRKSLVNYPWGDGSNGLFPSHGRKHLLQSVSVTVNRKWNRERVCRVIGKECGMSCFLVQGPKGASLVESVWEKGVLSRKTSSLPGPEWKDAWCDGATALNGGRGYLEALVIVTSQEATKRRLGMPLNIWQSTGSALRDKAHAGGTQPGNSVLETQRSHWWNRASP